MKINKLTSNIDYKKNIIKAKIINVKGSSPNKINDFMLVAPKDIFGTIGGGNLEYLVIEESKLMLKNKSKRKKLNIPLGPGIGQCCGGYVEIILTLHKNTDAAMKDEKVNDSFKEDLYIFGAGHIGQALIETIGNLNFNTYLIDSREEYLKMSVNKDVNYLLSKEPWKVVNKLKEKLMTVLSLCQTQASLLEKSNRRN